MGSTCWGSPLRWLGVRIVGAVWLPAAAAAGLSAAEVDDPTPDPAWSGEAGLSFVQMTGNSRTRTLGGTVKLRRQAEPWKVQATSAFVSTRAGDEESARRLEASLLAEHALGQRFATYLKAAFLSDVFAGLDGQTTGELGGRYELLETDRHVLVLSAALGFADERREAPAADLSFVSVGTDLTYEWKLARHSLFAQKVHALGNVDDSADWRLRSESTLSAAVTRLLALRLSHKLTHVNVPVPGKRRTDTTVLASLVVKWPK